MYSYLLEKSRVVHQQAMERNYHIFYQITAECATNKEFAKKMMLDNEELEYYYVNQSGVNTIEGVSDAEEFSNVQSAMEVCTILNIYRIKAKLRRFSNIFVLYLL